MSTHWCEHCTPALSALLFASCLCAHQHTGSVLFAFSHVLLRLQGKPWYRATFERFAARPYILGLLTMLNDDTGALPYPYQRLSRRTLHDLFHVEPQYKCMLTADGALAVDMFVRCASHATVLSNVTSCPRALAARHAGETNLVARGADWGAYPNTLLRNPSESMKQVWCRMGHYDEDFAAAVKEINARRDSRVPPLQADVEWTNSGKLLTSASAEPPESRHVAKYEACGIQCLINLQTYYSKDFKYLQFPTVEQVLA